MTLKWILLLFSKIKKQHHHLGTKIRKLKGKRKSWQLKNITSIFFLLCYSGLLREMNRKMVMNTKKIETDILLCLCMKCQYQSIKIEKENWGVMVGIKLN